MSAARWPGAWSPLPWLARGSWKGRAVAPGAAVGGGAVRRPHGQGAVAGLGADEGFTGAEEGVEVALEAVAGVDCDVPEDEGGGVGVVGDFEDD